MEVWFCSRSGPVQTEKRSHKLLPQEVSQRQEPESLTHLKQAATVTSPHDPRLIACGLRKAHLNPIQLSFITGTVNQCKMTDMKFGARYI